MAEASRDERRRVVIDWNATRGRYPREATIHGLIREHASLRPEAPALSFGERRMTYRELDDASSRVSSALRRLGVRRGSRVGVSTKRSLEQIVGLVGILKAGGAYVPFDPAYPQDRLATLVLDAHVEHTLDPDGSLAVPAAVHLLDTKALMAEPSRADDGPSDPGNARDEAYVLFTSGSTGRPKGVCVEHRGVVRLLRDAGWSRFGPDEVFLCYAALAFDASTLEIWGALINGSALVIAPPGVLGIDELGSLIRDAGVTYLFLTTGLFHLVVDEDIRVLHGVRQVVSGGDVLSPVHAQRVLREVPGIKVINAYGPTENSCMTTSHTVEPQRDGESVPIGKPVPQTTVYVLDERGEPAPIGVTGELFTGGDGVARGYVDARMTAERFVPDPFSDEPGKRLYRTGDMARWRSDGTLEFLGRRDGQVKVRGFRVEVGEIETAILRTGGVREAVVIVRDDPSVGKHLVAYLIAAAAPLDVDGLRGALAQSLPAFMVPSAFVVMASFPLTSIGKIDRASLPAPRMVAKHAFVEPEGRVETAIAEVFATTLRLPRIGALDDFLDLGGHSLTAAAICARLRATLGAGLDLRTVFEARTPRALAARVASTAHEARRQQIPRVDRAAALPLASQEARLWFLHSLDPRASTYNECAAVRVAGPPDRAAFDRAFARLEERHEALRTRYALEGERPARFVLPPSAPPVEHIAAADADAAARAIRHRARAPYDFDAGRLWRPIVVDLAGSDHIVALAMHHIITDEWSIHVLLDDLQRLYQSEVSGEPALLEPRPFELADWVAAQDDAEGAERAARDVAHFVRRLEGVDPVELPLDSTRPAQQSFDGKRLHRTLSEPLRLRVKALAHEEGATVAAVLLAVFGVLIHRHTGTRRFAVAVPIAGRAHPDLEHVAGFFVNTVAVDFDFSERRTVREVVRRTKEALLDAQMHGEAPFDRVVDAVVRTRDPRRPPLCQVSFAPQPPEAAIRAFAGHAASSFPVDVGTAKYDLTMEVLEREGGIDLQVEYATELFEEETAARMSARYERLLEGAVDAPDATAAVPLLPERERACIQSWSETARVFEEAPVHEQIARLARERPDAVAIVDGSRTVTYGELDRGAEAVARMLRVHGIGPEDRVATWFRRSADMIIAMLGVMKAGGAYLPLDPALPRDRLAFIVDDARARLVLSTPEVSTTADLGSAVIHTDTPMRGAEDVGPLPRTRPDQAAYVMYTSGTTGRPKGAVLEHRALANLVSDYTARTALVASDRVTQIASPAFDATTNEIWPALCAGAALLIVVDELRASPQRLVAWLREHAVTVTYMPTPLLEAVLDEDWTETTVRVATTGGQALRHRPEARHSFQLINIYGPTETTNYVTAEVVRPGDAAVRTIGSPIQNVAIHVVDEDLGAAPIGVVGEICIGGASVGRGYLARPSLTAQKFVPDPFSASPGARMYRTGDRGRWLATGTLEFSGRDDDQVKVRGFRIELGEIEAVLTSLPRVKACAVTAREDGSGHKRIVAYVVWDEGGGSIADARTSLAARLAPYMVPGAFVELDALPLTPNGKLDRTALPAPKLEAARETFVAPRTPLEKEIAEIWRELLRVSRVGLRDNFFELGAHSLTVTQLVARLQRVFRVEVEVRVVFEAPVLEALAERVLELQLVQLPAEELARLLDR